MARRPIKSRVARPDSLKPKTILPRGRPPSNKAAWWNILDPRWGQKEGEEYQKQEKERERRENAKKTS